MPPLVVGAHVTRPAGWSSAALLPLMFHHLKGPFFARGLEQVELGWILEDNLPMRRVLEGIGAKVYKTHRVYQKAIA